MSRRIVSAMLVGALLGLAPGPARALPPDFEDTLVQGGLDRPVCILPLPDGRIFIGELDGVVRVFENGTLNPTAVLTRSVELFEEQGLLGMALDPNFPTNPYMYVLYTPGAEPSTGGHHRISRFTLTGNIAGSEVTLFSDLPCGNGYHVAGCLRASSDGFLYAAVGDNGHGTGVQYAQQLSRLEGKMVRLTLAGGIPPSNPFVGTAGARGEIFHRGLRNPFRFAIHPVTLLPWINDVGQTSWEEINSGPAGSNFGWPTYEGNVGSPPAGITNPKHTYQWTGDGTSITGAAFYTGSQFPAEYLNNYFFLDHSKGWLGRVVIDAGGNVTSVNATWGITNTDGWLNGPVDLAVGSDGALYYTTYDPGMLRKVAYTGTVGVEPAPQSGLISLGPNVPNPFSHTTSIPFSLARAGHVQLGIYDVSGRRVATLMDESLDAGHHTGYWNGESADGVSAAPGIYVCRLESGSEVRWRRLARVR